MVGLGWHLLERKLLLGVDAHVAAMFGVAMVVVLGVPLAVAVLWCLLLLAPLDRILGSQW